MLVTMQRQNASYGHQSGLVMGENAKKHAPYLLAQARASEDEPHKAIDLSELASFFKALADAPEDQVAYANRFIANYTEAALGPAGRTQMTAIEP
jgi:hypothetical protein